ncbi:uncharacterized protein J3R85_008032, partial [Psidium guajava]
MKRRQSRIHKQVLFSLWKRIIHRVQYKFESRHIFEVSSLLPSASCTPSST